MNEAQETEFRAVAIGLGFELGDRDPVWTAETIDDFRKSWGEPKDMRRGYFLWDGENLNGRMLLVKDWGDFRAALVG